MNDRSFTPKGSPSLEKEHRSGQGKMGPPSTNRTSEALEQPAVVDANADNTEATTSSLQDEADAETLVSSLPFAPSSAAHTMPLPAQDNVSSSATLAGDSTQNAGMMPPPASKPPKSGQAAASRSKPRGTHKAAKGERSHLPKAVQAPHATETFPETQSSLATRGGLDEQMHDESDSDVTVTPSEPHIPIQRFAWDDLEQRYHHEMGELGAKERKIWDEFQGLSQYFGEWVETSCGHEVSRSFKRLKTQSAFVQHEEEELEDRREHYVKVVDAFKSAIQLLEK